MIRCIELYPLYYGSGHVYFGILHMQAQETTIFTRNIAEYFAAVPWYDCKKGDLCMEYHNFDYCLTIVETGNITRAAEKHYISQPSMTQYLNKLEKRLGVKLFDRSSTPLSLTKAGWSESARQNMRSTGRSRRTVRNSSGRSRMRMWSSIGSRNIMIGQEKNKAGQIISWNVQIP